MLNHICCFTSFDVTMFICGPTNQHSILTYFCPLFLIWKFVFFNKITSSICSDIEVDVCCLHPALLSGAVEIVKQTCIRSIRVKDFEASKFKG